MRAALQGLIEIGQGTVKKGCFIDRVSLVTHGKFVRQIAESEYWQRQRRSKPVPPKMATIPTDYNITAAAEAPAAPSASQ